MNTSRLKVFKADITPPSTVRCEMYEMRRDDTEDLCGIRDPEEEVGRGIGVGKNHHGIGVGKNHHGWYFSDCQIETYW